MRIVVETDSSVAGGMMPAQGEVWLSVESGMLYEMREWKEAVTGGWQNTNCGAHRTAHRIDAPEERYGCDPSVFVAVFDEDVRNGRWLRVMNCPAVKTA